MCTSKEKWITLLHMRSSWLFLKKKTTMRSIKMQSAQRELGPCLFFSIGGSLECQLVQYWEKSKK